VYDDFNAHTCRMGTIVDLAKKRAQKALNIASELDKFGAKFGKFSALTQDTEHTVEGGGGGGGGGGGEVRFADDKSAVGLEREREDQ
jgi:hypothetical protein